jgi:hypothetical protein
MYKVPSTRYKVEIRYCSKYLILDTSDLILHMSNIERRRNSYYSNPLLGTLYFVLGTIKAENILLLESPTWFLVLGSWYNLLDT